MVLEQGKYSRANITPFHSDDDNFYDFYIDNS